MHTLKKDHLIDRQYDGIDLWKFIMSFAVVAIHTNPLKTPKMPFSSQSIIFLFVLLFLFSSCLQDICWQLKWIILPDANVICEESKSSYTALFKCI